METAPPPNIIVVLTDDQGYGDLGCHGNAILQTPGIDSFHSRAVRFTQFHSGTTCAPTRAGLLTGLNANSAGVWHTIGGASLLRNGIPTLPEILRENGYRTGLFGKWHLGDDYPYRPHDRGFEKAVYHRGGGITQVSDHWGNTYYNDTYLVNGEPRSFSGYCTDVFFREAFDFIRNHRNEPFCCFITPNAPHAPFNVEKKYRALYAEEDLPENRKRFYGMITNIDENFSALETLLKELYLEENTILIFMTDNGSVAGCSHGEDQFVNCGFNAGMRGKKGSQYDGGHRVPFFLRYPSARLDAGRDISTLSGYIDFMPTLLDLCGIQSPPVEGRSLRPLLLDENAGSKDFEQRILVTDTQRVPYPIKWRLSSVMQGDWRLVCGKELYNIAQDPEQRNDVAALHPDKVSELRTGYEDWWDLCSRQFNTVAPTHIGSLKSPQIDLTTLEQCNENSDVVWHQGQVRKGQVSLGWWDLWAETSGTYEIALLRWPEETDYPIRSGISGFDCGTVPEGFLAESSLDWYRDGRALDIQGATLKIGRKSWYQDIEEDEKQALFRVELEKGPHQLRAWFSGGNNLMNSVFMSPYYVIIRKP